MSGILDKSTMGVGIALLVASIVALSGCSSDCSSQRMAMGAAMKKTSSLKDKVFGPGGGAERRKSGEISDSQYQEQYVKPWQEATEAERGATRTWKACLSS